jgi:hypothetical protein
VLKLLIFDQDYGRDWLAVVQRLASSQHLALVAQINSSNRQHKGIFDLFVAWPVVTVFL